MGIHLGFYLSLNKVPASQAVITEPLQAAFGNILAILVEVSLLSGISVAYDQALWRLFHRKPLKAFIIDKLATLVSSPWNLFRKDIIVSAPLEWFLSLLRFLIAIAAVFPPGALTVKSKPFILPETQPIPTMDMSYWGDGSLDDFANHALFVITTDFEQRNESGFSVFDPSFNRNDELNWTNDRPITKSFYNYFWQDGQLKSSPVNTSDLTTQFTRTQAFALREAAIQALIGNVTVVQSNDSLSAAPFLKPAGTLVVGSPFVTGSLNPQFSGISPWNLQKYLQDVVISAIDKSFTHYEQITVLQDAETFVFSNPGQFYGPYAACLITTLAIYWIGIWSLRQNGVSAGNSFLQWVTTTRASDKLDYTAKHCSPGGQENFSYDLNHMELRFGLRRGGEEPEDRHNAGIAGFGIVEEIKPCHNA
ncbi:unnamed protein product [Alternaria alternata]